ncbi:hypothetical protein H6F43_10680 [Leptolyngbya sp. FACHB-36]|uniref:hypothetical protein n=1 Tax=Leptolyngbya sp. FACHB-36 TaxID=2692808 RepID=UPI001680BDD9|nr:hypothetical protein [Leptolyngbya sp. FACHB-36]MBD2020645.1 hypothetical protein [Leptolyngbya sp. FACHB-36]
MSGIYSTEDLIRILAEERRACLRGQRLNLNASPTGFSPVIDQFLATDGIQKFTAYSDFRTTVHQYQREHQISGIVWQTIAVNGKAMDCPRVHDQLIALPGDLALLRSKRDTILNFWHEVTAAMELFLSLNSGKIHQPINLVDVDRIVQRSEWASLSQQGNAQSVELILQLGWGKPEEATYRRGFPESGSEYVHAVNPGQRPVG